IGLYRNAGHEQVHIRAGVHIGPVGIATEDAFGQHVSMAARVESKAKDGGIWVSERVKEDIDALGAPRHHQLKWIEHRNLKLKGFPRRHNLWALDLVLERPEKVKD